MSLVMPGHHESELSVYDVFTPTTSSPAGSIPRPTLSAAIRDAINTPGRQLLLYGQTGAGKSTALFRELTSRYVVARCTPETSLASLLAAAMSRYNMRGFSDASIALPVAAAELGRRGLRVVLEDAHRLSALERARLASAMKVFSDLGNQFPDLMIIAVAAVETPEQFGRFDLEVTSRTAEVHVPVMTTDEIRAIVETGAALLNVSTTEIIDDIAIDAAGMPGIAHSLALASFLDAGIYAKSDTVRTVTPDALSHAVSARLAIVPAQVKARFEAALEPARHRDMVCQVLTALAAADPTGLTVTEIIDELGLTGSRSLRDYVPEVVALLTGESRVLYVDDRDNVRFVSGLLHSYWAMLAGTRVIANMCT